ncbi:MAG: hypothetical protein JWR50_3705 [Mucilaginibacter sp.]|nr:hypothetical protein [Mucilaginibacter sp.]
MYFLLSKVFLFLLLPTYWVIALVVISLVSKNRKRKKRFFIAAGVVFYLFSAPFFQLCFQKVWDVKPYAIDSNKKYNCVIVLGGFSSGTSETDGHFNFSADRFIQGVKLFETKKASHILISGGNGILVPSGFKEATWVKTQLLEFNIPDSLILIENQSKNTVENAQFSKLVLAKSHLPPPYLLVTSAFHMRRASMIFKKAGIDVVPYPCNFFGNDVSFGIMNFFPDSNVLYNWEFYTKEVVGYVVNYFKH